MKRAALVLLILLCLLWQIIALAGEGLTVTWLDVGQGDCAFLTCEGHSMLIDGGNPDNSRMIYSFLKNTAKTERLDLVIATHPHEDHIGGIISAFEACQVNILLTPVNHYDSRRFRKMLLRARDQKTSVIVPEVGEVYHLGSAEVQVLSPSHAYEDMNDCSIIVKVTYGSTSFLFTGDAEQAAEADLVASGMDLRADVLKVGHHGSGTSSLPEFLNAVQPRYAVISVGYGNKYGHPSEGLVYELEEYLGAEVYRTDLDGMIRCFSDGESLSFITESDMTDDPEEPEAGAEDNTQDWNYIGNFKSKKFHIPGCSGAQKMSEENKVPLNSREEAINEGYSPCGICQP